MRFKQLWSMLERTLYHGTVIDNLDSIQRGDLQGQVGHFVQTSYDELPEEELPALVFAADKQGISGALTAMVAHIGKKLNKSFHDVTDDDILRNGLLVIIRDGDSMSQHRPEDDENYYGQHPHTVEPGDYYADELPANGFIRGRTLLRFLRSLGAWPRTWGEPTERSEKMMRGELIRIAIAKHPERSKEEIIQRIQSLPIKDVKSFLSSYRRT